MSVWVYKFICWCLSLSPSLLLFIAYAFEIIENNQFKLNTSSLDEPYGNLHNVTGYRTRCICACVSARIIMLKTLYFIPVCFEYVDVGAHYFIYIKPLSSENFRRTQMSFGPKTGTWRYVHAPRTYNGLWC